MSNTKNPRGGRLELDVARPVLKKKACNGLRVGRRPATNCHVYWVSVVLLVELNVASRSFYRPLSLYHLRLLLFLYFDHAGPPATYLDYIRLVPTGLYQPIRDTLAWPDNLLRSFSLSSSSPSQFAVHYSHRTFAKRRQNADHFDFYDRFHRLSFRYEIFY